MIFAKGIIESEIERDNFLCLDTNGRHDKCSNFERSPYEPTLYPVLDALAESGLLCEKDRLVDFGSGKGRATIYLSAKTNCESIGVEFIGELYQLAIENAKKTHLKHRASFVNTLAENYQINIEDNCFYFANPFSVNVLKKVLDNIYTSLRKHPRQVKLFFHYMTKEHLDFLSNEHCLKHVDTIDCRQLFCQYTGRENVMFYEVTSLEGQNEI